MRTSKKLGISIGLILVIIGITYLLSGIDSKDTDKKNMDASIVESSIDETTKLSSEIAIRLIPTLTGDLV